MRAHNQVMIAQKITQSGGGGGSTTFITSNNQTNRSGSYCVGFAFTVGGAGITVTDLGRIISATGNKSRNIYIYNFNSSGSYAQVATCTISTNGASVGNYVFATCGSVALAASTTYIIFSDETADDIGWSDNSSITPTAVATVVGSYYAGGTFPPAFGTWTLGVSGNNSYAGPNFKYTQP